MEHEYEIFNNIHPWMATIKRVICNLIYISKQLNFRAPTTVSLTKAPNSWYYKGTIVLYPIYGFPLLRAQQQIPKPALLPLTFHPSIPQFH